MGLFIPVSRPSQGTPGQIRDSPASGAPTEAARSPRPVSQGQIQGAAGPGIKPETEYTIDTCTNHSQIQYSV